MPSLSAYLIPFTLLTLLPQTLATTTSTSNHPIFAPNNIRLEPHTVIATATTGASAGTLQTTVNASSVFASLVSAASMETGAVSAVEGNITIGALSTIETTTAFSAGMTSPSATTGLSSATAAVVGSSSEASGGAATAGSSAPAAAANSAWNAERKRVFVLAGLGMVVAGVLL